MFRHLHVQKELNYKVVQGQIIKAENVLLHTAKQLLKKEAVKAKQDVKKDMTEQKHEAMMKSTHAQHESQQMTHQMKQDAVKTANTAKAATKP